MEALVSKVNLHGGEAFHPVVLKDTDRVKDVMPSGFLGWKGKSNLFPG